MYSVWGCCFAQRAAEINKTDLCVASRERGLGAMTSLSAAEDAQVVVNTPGPQEGFLDDIDKVCLSRGQARTGELYERRGWNCKPPAIFRKGGFNVCSFPKQKTLPVTSASHGFKPL